MKIEDYALIGDMRTAALVGKNGSIDWLCVPRFDAGACFAALLGSAENGRWLLAPCAAPNRIERAYRKDTLVLETVYETDTGSLKVTDYMPLGGHPVITRIVECLSGTVKMRCELVMRFDYGKTVPWVRNPDGKLKLQCAGPRRPAVGIARDIKNVEGMSSIRAEFRGDAAGDRVPFVLSWFPSHEAPPAPVVSEQTLAATEEFWQAWCAKGQDDGPYRDHIVRSLITLKALTYCAYGRHV